MDGEGQPKSRRDGKARRLIRSVIRRTICMSDSNKSLDLGVFSARRSMRISINNSYVRYDSYVRYGVLWPAIQHDRSCMI